MQNFDSSKSNVNINKNKLAQNIDFQKRSQNMINTSSTNNVPISPINKKGATLDGSAFKTRKISMNS